ncbi:MAG: transposase [Melioribacteraceae bacterium]|nr:transposase [Melioribacteraceae bacterium]MCF8265213.1 transposase [Melioribacteraceae bacterium]MCF8428480.1 transposase [Bacteroidia bacterium]
MNEIKLKVNHSNDNNDYPNFIDQFDHFIGVDWSMKNMSIARLTKNMIAPKVIDVQTDLSDLKHYLRNLIGAKILTIEETTSSHWLYVELYDYVDKIVICDPYRNRLLSEGPKNDKIDAGKLTLLLKNGLLKEVYHTTDSLYELRMLISAYNDLVGAGVRLQNQKSAIYRAENKSHKKDKIKIKNFILTQLDDNIENYYNKKKLYEV